jgi:hypothetical protein
LEPIEGQGKTFLKKNFTSWAFMPCPFTGPEMFWAGQSQTFCGRQKDDLHSVKLVFVPTQVFEEALNAVIFLGWLKKIGPQQNILGPVKGQGINFFF